MAQLFQNNEVFKKLHEFIAQAKYKNIDEQLKFAYDNIYDHPITARILRESGAVDDIGFIFSNDFWYENFNEILESYEFVGTYETIITLCKKALGEGTDVQFETIAPAHLKMTVSQFTDARDRITLPDHLKREVMTDGGLIEFRQADIPIVSYTINQVKAMIETIRPAHIYYEYNFI